MIIVEGADNAGKTLLVTQLLEAEPTLMLLGRKKFRPERGENIASSYMRMLKPHTLDDITEISRHAFSVADRCLISECIYGTVHRQQCSMTPFEHLNILSTLQMFKALIVFCDPGDAAIKRSWHEREQLYPYEPKIANQYRKNFESIFHGLPVMYYNWWLPGAAEHVQVILEKHHNLYQSFLYELERFPHDHI